MKIVCVIKTSHGARWLVGQVEAMVLRGHDVTVLLPAPEGSLGDELRSAGAMVRAAPATIALSRLHRFPFDLLRLRAAIRAERPQVIFYQLWASAVMARLASVRMRNVRRVHMVPGPLFLENGIIRAVERALVGFDDLIIAGSRHTADRYRRLGVPRERVTNIPYGVDLRRYRPAGRDERQRSREALGIDPGAFVVVMVALVYGGKLLVHRGRPIKGHEDLLWAWGSFRPAQRAKHLLLVGDGFDAGGRAHRRQLMRSFAIDVDPTITWLPTVADVRSYYAAADVSVSPSLSDNHGAAVEASAMGVPSIVSNAGALGEVVDSAGWIFPAGDRRQLLARLSEAASLSAQELDALRLASRRNAERDFDAVACLDQLVTLLEREGARAATIRP